MVDGHGVPDFEDMDGDGTPNSEDSDIDGDGIRNHDDANPYHNANYERRQRYQAGFKYGLASNPPQQAFFSIPEEDAGQSLPFDLNGFPGTAKQVAGGWVLYDEHGNLIGLYVPVGNKNFPIGGKVYRNYSPEVGWFGTQAEPLRRLMVDIEDLMELMSGKYGRGPSYLTDAAGWDRYFLKHDDPDHPNAVPTDEEMENRLAGAGPLVTAMLTPVALELGLELGGAQIIGYAIGKRSKLLLKLDSGRVLAVPGARKLLDRLSGLNANILRRNLGLKRGDGLFAHHIVPSTHRRGQAARDLLESFGIGINDAVNGAPVPKEIHDLLHTKDAIDAVTDRLEGAIEGISDKAVAKASPWTSGLLSWLLGKTPETPLCSAY